MHIGTSLEILDSWLRRAMVQVSFSPNRRDKVSLAIKKKSSKKLIEDKFYYEKVVVACQRAAAYDINTMVEKHQNSL
jgi:hypothetical protein